MSGDDKKPDGDPKDIPALFATIHHQSDARPDGYTPDDIAEMNRLANGDAAPPGDQADDDRNPPASKAATSSRWKIIGASVTLGTVIAMGAGLVFALRTASNSDPISPGPSPSFVAEPSVAPPVEDVPAPTHMEVRGIYIDQVRDEAEAALASRGFIVGPDNSPIMEMHFGLPRHEQASAIYFDIPECREELDRRANMSAEEAESIAAMRLQSCRLAGRVFYGRYNDIVAFYLTPEAFDIEGITLADFAQAAVDNHEVDELTPEQVRLRTLGFDGYCTDYLGRGLGGVRVKVSDCGFKRMQVEASPTSNAEFH